MHARQKTCSFIVYSLPSPSIRTLIDEHLPPSSLFPSLPNRRETIGAVHKHMPRTFAFIRTASTTIIPAEHFLVLRLSIQEIIRRYCTVDVKNKTSTFGLPTSFVLCSRFHPDRSREPQSISSSNAPDIMRCPRKRSGPWSCRGGVYFKITRPNYS